MRKVLFSVWVYLLLVSSVYAATYYIVETEHNNELYIINGEKYEAKTYCYGINEGDRVIFLEGSPLGACSSAVIYDLDTKEKCELWCE